MKTILLLTGILLCTATFAQRSGYGRYNYHAYEGYQQYYGHRHYMPDFYVAPHYIRPYYPVCRPYVFVPRPAYCPPTLSVHINANRPYYGESQTGYTPDNNTLYAMSTPDFERAKSSIYSRPTDEGKMLIAQQVVDANYLTSAQVREILNIFTFEDSRLEFAKYAYSRTIDPANYYLVNDAFTYDGSVSALNDYLHRQR